MVPSLSIGERTIGENSSAYFIAEAGINHNGSIQIAKEMVDIAAEAGADAVKFQKRVLEETYVEDVVENPAMAEMDVEYTVSNLKSVLLTDSEFRELARYCEDRNIQFLCSPWDGQSVDLLESIDVKLYKIGSPDMTNFVLLERVMDTDKPILVSTGMSEQREVEETVRFLNDRDAEFALLHCRSTYPAPFHNLNLSYIEKLREMFQVPVGYSGHERGIAVSTAAVAMGACVIERHFTLSRDMEGPDHAASLEPTGLEKQIRDIRNLEESRGKPRRYMTRGEYSNRVSLAKSLVAKTDISEGERIARDMLTAKSPARGISPQELYTVVGSTARRDVSKDSFVQWNDIAEPERNTYDIELDNWGIVVRHSDIDAHDWGNPDLFEFRINGADLDEEFDLGTYQVQLGIHAPEQKGHDLVDLSAQDEESRRQAVGIIQRLIDKVRDEIAPAFPATDEPYVVVHPGGITLNRMDLDAVPEMNAALERSMDELDDRGVTLLLENMPPLPWIYGGQRYHNNFMAADEIAEFCESTGMKICYDTSHAQLWCNYADESLVEHARTLRPYVRYLHVADAIGDDGEGIQIGDGDIAWSEILPVFSDFDGPVVTEIWRGHERRGAGFKKAAARLGEMWS